MWYEELTECDYFGEEYANLLTSVGWLENEKFYKTGKTSKNFYEKLCELGKDPWGFVAFAGFHGCDLCQFDGKCEVSNIFIPHNNKIFVCPKLIIHYVNAHSYLPPDEFIEAVLVCPPMRSMAYHKKMLENGGRKLLKLSKEEK